MEMTEFLAQLGRAESEQAKAALVAEFTFDKSPQFAADAARRCGFLPWFSEEIIQAQLAPDDRQRAAEAVEFTLGLPFVEQVTVGYAFHSQTRQGLIERYAERQPDEIVEAYRQALPVWEADWDDDDAAATAAISGLMVTGDHDHLISKMNEFVFRELGQNDLVKVNQMIEALNEVEAYPFVEPMPAMGRALIILSRALYQHFGESDYEAAIESYHLAQKAFVELGVPTVYYLISYLRGEAHASMKEYEEAIEQYDLAVARNPDSAYILRARGKAHTNSGDHEAAIADLDRAIELEPESSKSYELRGLAYLGLQDLKKALANYDRAVELNPDADSVHIGRGLVHTVLSNVDQALADLNRGLELNPDSVEGYFTRGTAYRAAGEWDLAIADYDQAITLKPDDANAYGARGRTYWLKGDTSQARDDLDQAIAIDPQNAQAYYYRGRVSAQEQDSKRAIADYDAAISIDPNYADAYYRRALEYVAKEENEKAMADLERAIELNPKESGAYWFRGLIYYARQDTGRAIADFSEVISQRPDYAEAYVYRGTVRHQIGQVEEAVADYSHVLEMEAPPEQRTAAFENLALIRRLDGQFREAVELLEQAIEISPDNPTAHVSLAACYRALGDEARYEAEAQRVRELMTGQSEYNLACMEAVLGNTDEALHLLETALEKGQVLIEWMRRDPDLASIREEPGFQQLLARYGGES